MKLSWVRSGEEYRGFGELQMMELERDLVGIEAPRNLNYVVDSLVDEPFTATPQKIEQLDTWKIYGEDIIYTTQ